MTPDTAAPDPAQLRRRKLRPIFLSGATMWEWQIGRLYGGFLKPRYWCRRNLSRLVLVRWDHDDT